MKIYPCLTLAEYYDYHCIKYYSTNDFLGFTAVFDGKNRSSIVLFSILYVVFVYREAQPKAM